MRLLCTYIFCFFAFVNLLPIGANAAQQYSVLGITMGTNYKVNYVASDSLIAKSKVDSLLDVINRSFSLYLEHSVISRVNRADSSQPVDDHFSEVFRKASEICRQTNGYFDFTVMPLVEAWGFGPKKQIYTDSVHIDSLREFVGCQKTRLECQSGQCWLRKKRPGVKLDFNAIAKGYGIDVLVQFIESRGIENYLVEIGGEVRAKGKTERATPWKVGLHHPATDSIPQRLFAVLQLDNQAIATSGNYRNYIVKDGVRYGHTINPKTGRPELNRLLSVSVIADNCMTADAYATAFMSMGLNRTKKFLQDNSTLEAILIYSDKDGDLSFFYTSGLEETLSIR